MPSKNLIMEDLVFAKGIDPIANAFAGTVYSDVYNVSLHGQIAFVIYTGVGLTGTSTLTVEACDNVTPSNVAAIPFWYREVLTGDAQGTIVRAATTGYVTTAGSSKIIIVEASASDVAAAVVNGATGNKYVRLKAVESVASAVLGGIMALVGGRPNRYHGSAAPITTIV